MSVTHLALLRAVNLGGNTTLPMKDLAALFAEAGCSDVRTYIQSGNVVFVAPPSGTKGLADGLAARIGERFGFRPQVILRTAEEMRDVVANNPFLAEGIAEAALHVMFLTDRPDPANAARLDPDRSPGDAFVVRGREVYLHLPYGVGRSKLTNAYVDAKLATTGTARNWRTVTKLLAMMDE